MEAIRPNHESVTATSRVAATEEPRLWRRHRLESFSGKMEPLEQRASTSKAQLFELVTKVATLSDLVLFFQWNNVVVVAALIIPINMAMTIDDY
ncbi:hypothetical protein Hdeb2414_s0017g00504901 [Helianthus debilis subsp. tardiflorus]